MIKEIITDMSVHMDKTIDALRRAGWKVEVLSGDDDDVVKHAAKALGISGADARAHCGSAGI